METPLVWEPWPSILAAAFVAAQAEMPDITKGRNAKIDMKGGGSFSYTYADLGDVLSAVRPILAKHGLAITQDVATHDRMIDVYTTIVHTSGESHRDGPLGFDAGGDPRTAGSAVTYARRYAILATLGLATEDDDGARASTVHRQDRTPPPADPIADLYGRIKAAAGTPVAAELKKLATDNGRKLSPADLASDDRWFELVTATLKGAA